MTIADPAGLLARIPELEALGEDARVRRAIERGDPLGLYRALFWGLRFGRFGQHRALVASLLARRRLFVAPIRSVPTLFTLNGIGTTAYGRTDVDPNDQTYILTQMATVLFVPVFPLGQFLVRDAAPAGARRAWSFIGKVPFGPAVYAWNRLLSLAAVLSVLVGVGSAWRSSRFHDVHIVNGLSVPVRARLAAQTIEVAPKSHGLVTAPVGTHPLAITRLDDRPIETAELAVKRGAHHVLCWNVLGAAPVYRETITYSKAATDQEPSITVSCGEERIVYEDVNDLWVDPPKTVSLSSSTSEITRGHVDLDQGGARACAVYLANHGRMPQAADMIRRVAEVSDYEDDAVSIAASMISEASGGDEAFAWSRSAVAARPASLELHRTYQTFATRLGKRAEILPEYKARYQKESNSADAGYLLARLESPADSVTLLGDLVDRFPKHVAARRAHAFNEYQLRNFEEALASWKVLRELDREDWSHHLPMIARAMVGMERGGDALGEVESAFSKKDGDQGDLAALYGEIALGLGQNGEKLFDKLKDGVPASRIAWLRLGAGLPFDINKLEEPAHHEAGAIWLAARTAPDDALARASKAPERAVRYLSEAVWTLLYGEAWRREPEGDVTKALVKSTPLSAAEVKSVLGFLKTGTVDAELAEATFEVRAAAELVRSRMPSLPESERRKLVIRARQDDLLHGAVTAAIDAWKP